MYLLDTNHCTRAIEGDRSVRQRIAESADSEISTCIIVRAELLFMAYRSERIASNLDRVRIFLSGIAIYQIDDEVCDVYARIKADIFRHFGPKERAKQRHTTLDDLGFTENDLWIAAITLRHDLIVVSGDGDFGRLAEISDLRHESWLIEHLSGA